MKSLLVFILLLPLTLFSYTITPTVPGHFCTPSNPDFDGYRYPEQIPHCKRNVSSAMKDQVCREEGVPVRTHDYTVDHIIPLSLSGSNDRMNLWCQHVSLNVTRLEYQMYTLVRNGDMPVEEAIKILLDKKFNR